MSILAFNVIAYVLVRAVGCGVNAFGGPINVRLTAIASAVFIVLFGLQLKLRSVYIAGAIPDAGGDLISEYCSPRFSYARSCIGRTPNTLAWVDVPLRAQETDAAGTVIVISGV